MFWFFIKSYILAFQSTLPAGEATSLKQRSWLAVEFQSTLPAGEATSTAPCIISNIVISIHASRGGSDPNGIIVETKGVFISIHASRGGSDPAGFLLPRSRIKFQSTLPAGEATLLRLPVSEFHRYFNPRFPRGKRHCRRCCSTARCLFQSTLPAGEATLSFLFSHASFTVFQSTLPAGEATMNMVIMRVAYDYFNPRFPRGKRHSFMNACSINNVISIHASRGGSDPYPCS